MRSTSGARVNAGSPARPSPRRPTSTVRRTPWWRSCRRLGSSFVVDELADLYGKDTDWALELARRNAAGTDAASVVVAAFARYLREAKDYAGGRPRETHEKP